MTIARAIRFRKRLCHPEAVPVTVSAAAARAAVSVAARLGVACAEPAVLADGANVIVHLSPSPVVAKVAASTPAVRADAEVADAILAAAAKTACQS